MNPLDYHPELRRKLYLVQWIVNLVLGIVAIVLTTLGQSPIWYVIVTGSFNFIWSYTGITAQTNVDTTPIEE